MFIRFFNFSFFLVISFIDFIQFILTLTLICGFVITTRCRLGMGFESSKQFAVDGPQSTFLEYLAQYLMIYFACEFNNFYYQKLKMIVN
jgi:hypothetical protein